MAVIRRIVYDVPLTLEITDNMVVAVHDTPQVIERIPVMTKEVFIECYNKWIKDGLWEDLKKVSVALSDITQKECCDYGYEEACDIADRYAKGEEE